MWPSPWPAVPSTSSVRGVIEIRLSGALRPWVSAKDVILTVLEHFGTKGNVNCIFEYTGRGWRRSRSPNGPPSATWGPSVG
ncbi:MAG: aconitase family protein [Sphaerochaeta sp.]